MGLVAGRRNVLAVVAVCLAFGCGGGGDNGPDTPPPPPPPPTFTVGGTVTGLTGTGLVIRNNGSNDLTIPAAATSYTFPGSNGSGSGYNVTIKTQPTGPSQACVVSNGTGTISGANVSVPVTCTVNTFAVGGTITGLTGTGLTLLLNGGSPLVVASGTGGFSFPNITSGSNYAVTIGTQPSNPVQNCTIANGSGTVGAGAVANIAVTCVTVSYTIGGATAGLSGTGLVLQNNNRDDLAVPGGATSFAFASTALPGAAYNVSIKTQPAGPAQSCSVANATGTANANVTSVVVNCVTNTTVIGGTVSGLTGSGLSLLLNGGAPLAIPAAATGFAFPTALAPGNSYAVTIAAHPVGQTCAVANGTGTAGASNVTTVAVTCADNAANTWTVGGPITGLSAPGLILNLNGSTILTVPAGATSYAFPARPNGPYNVAITAQPVNQNCQLGGTANGTIASANVTNVAVTCTVNAYLVKGTIAGLVGGGLNILLNGGSRQVVPPGTTSFTFAGHVNSGAAYTVVVAGQPRNPTQVCTVANGTGTMGSGDVTDVAITCTTVYTVGGTIGPTLLYSNGGVLLLNGGSAFNMKVDQPNFTFPGLPAGTPYTVSVGTQPGAPPHTCTVTNGSGVIGAANVTDVQVSCVPDGFIITGGVGGYSGTGLTLGAEVVRNGALVSPVVPLTPQSQGKYAFPGLYNPDDQYSVFILTQPAGQTCTIIQGTGRVPTLAENPFGGFYVSSAKIKCVNNVTSPLSGVYSVLIGSQRHYIAFWPDGTFTLAVRSNDASCPDNGNGIEYGVYNYNAATNAFAVLDVPVDTDGGCGIIDPVQPLPVTTLTRSGNTITLGTDVGPVTLTEVTSNAGTLVGAFGFATGANGVFVVFQADNTYIIAGPQGASSHGNLTRPGYERACYAATASTITANLTGSCTPDGGAVVDNNGKSGFSDAGGPVPFTITGPGTLSIDHIKLVRLVP